MTDEQAWAMIRRDKELARQKAAAQTFAQKLAVLDRLKERAQALRSTPAPKRDT